MPYHKKYQSRKFGKKSSFTKAVKKIISKQHERKFAEVATASLTPSATMATANAHLSGIAQGDSEETRDGNELRVKSIRVNYTIQQNPSATATMVRVVIARMKSTINDTAPDWNNIFVEDTIETHKDHRLAQRFNILMDRTHLLGDKILQLGKYYKACDYKVKFNGPASNDYESGNLFIWFVSNEVLNTPTVRYSTQVSFEDA